MQTAQPDYYTSDNQESDHNLSDYESGENVAYGEQPANSTSESVTTPDGAANITNNYYGGGGYDDYYDYSYASRINRFYGPTMGFNYYSPFYTGYYSDPWYWNSYSYMPSFYFGYNWGWGSFGYGYPYYSYYPYYYYPYNNYWYGYNDGYWNGYYDGYYGSNYYPYADNGNYYGHRPSRGGSNSPVTSRNSYFSGSDLMNTGRPSSLEVTRPPVNGDNTSTRSSILQEGSNPSKITSGSLEKNQNVNPIVSGKNERVNESNSNRESGVNNKIETGARGGAILAGDKTKPQNDAATSKQSQTNAKPRYIYKKPETSPKNEVTEKYKPGQDINTNKNSWNSNRTEKYAKPTDYSVSENMRTSKEETKTTRTNTQTYTKPQSNYSRSYEKPARYNSSENNSSRSYSQPARSNNGSYTPPSRSSNSYSPPSRSSNSNSYSTPSRSSSRSSSFSSPSRSSSPSYTPSRSSSSGSSSSSKSSSRGGRK